MKEKRVKHFARCFYFGCIVKALEFLKKAFLSLSWNLTHISILYLHPDFSRRGYFTVIAVCNREEMSLSEN